MFRDVCGRANLLPSPRVTRELRDTQIKIRFDAAIWSTCVGKNFFFRCHSHLEGRVKQIWESSASEIAAGGEFRLDFCFCIEPQLKLRNRFSGGKFDENFFLNEPSQSAWACQEPLG